MTKQKKTLAVWDPVVRIGHWILVFSFFTAYFTEDDFVNVHVWAGYLVGAYLLMRILWGFVGGKYARFSSFVYPPNQVIGYLKNLISSKPQHYTGHNPAAGAMVIALLLSLSATTLTGLKLYAVEENKGPFALSSVTQAQIKIQSANLISTAIVEEDEDDAEKSERIDSKYKIDKQAEEFWEELHEIFTNLTLLLVILHIIGVVASSYVDKEQLIKAMFTGNKDIDDSYQ